MSERDWMILTLIVAIVVLVIVCTSWYGMTRRQKIVEPPHTIDWPPTAEEAIQAHEDREIVNLQPHIANWDRPSSQLDTEK